MNSCSHLYVIDPGTGAVLAEIGSTGRRFISDIDFAEDGTLYGSQFLVGGTNLEQAALITLDPTTAALTLIGRFGLFQVNGGLSVHPQTGELWGVEANFSGAPAIFKIDPVSGAASNIVRLGLNGQPTGFGLDALEILPDGRFIALQGGKGFAGSNLYEIDPAPDLVSGLAELTLIPLSLDPAITGPLNGLESRPTPEQQLDFLIGDVQELIDANVLDQAGNGLLKILGAALGSVQNGRPSAIPQLNAFIRAVEGFIRGGLLTDEQGQALIATAQSIIDQLSP